jgi:hypothetical protein
MLYIVPKHVYEQHHNNAFGTHFSGPTHALDLPETNLTDPTPEIEKAVKDKTFNTSHSELYKMWSNRPYVLVRATFANETKRKAFESNPHVICLPHALSGKKLTDEIATHLAHLGITKDHTTLDVHEKASAQWSVFELRHQ